MRLSYDPERKPRYLDGEREVVSVTHLLGATGAAKDLAFLNLDQTYCDRGSAVHYIGELVGRGEYDQSKTTENLWHYGREIIKWTTDTGFKAKVWELPMYDRRLRIAGTLDVLGEAPNGDIWLNDLKTGTIQECGVACQLAGYEALLLKGEVIEDGAGDYDREFVKYARSHPELIRRHSLNLKETGPYTFRSHSEPIWQLRWRSEVTHYHMMTEFGLFRKERPA